MSIILIFFAVTLDVVSCTYNTLKVLGKVNSSGIPAVSLVIYLLVFLWDKDVVIFAQYLDILIFSGVHVTLQYGIPYLVKILQVKTK